MHQTRKRSRVIVLGFIFGLGVSSCHEGQPFPALEDPALSGGGTSGAPVTEHEHATGGAPQGGSGGSLPVDPPDPTGRSSGGDAPVVVTTASGGSDPGMGGLGGAPGGGNVGTEHSGGVSGGGGAGVGGSIGTPTEVIPRPPVVLAVGRLSSPATACWVGQPGTTAPIEWQQRRSLYQSVFNEWVVGTSLVINWKDECDPALPDGTHVEDLRILLEDRLSDERPAEIEDCAESHRAPTWAITPDEHDSFRSCAWNMSISSFLPSKSTVLHTAGHALGIVHDHFGSLDVCPFDLPEERSFGPYLAEFDWESALLVGMSYDESVDADLRCGLPTGWNDAELSRGDRLTISMLYPLAFEHELYPRTAAIRFNGSWVFREDAVIAFESAWLRAGASSDWFIEPRWEFQSDGGGWTIGSSGLYGAYTIAPAQAGTLTHTFFDPFFEEHSASEEVQMSNTKHAAVVSTIL